MVVQHEDDHGSPGSVANGLVVIDDLEVVLLDSISGGSKFTLIQAVVRLSHSDVDVLEEDFVEFLVALAVGVESGEDPGPPWSSSC